MYRDCLARLHERYVGPYGGRVRAPSYRGWWRYVRTGG